MPLAGRPSALRKGQRPAHPGQGRRALSIALCVNRPEPRAGPPALLFMDPENSLSDFRARVAGGREIHPSRGRPSGAWPLSDQVLFSRARARVRVFVAKLPAALPRRFVYLLMRLYTSPEKPLTGLPQGDQRGDVAPLMRCTVRCTSARADEGAREVFGPLCVRSSAPEAAEPHFVYQAR